MGFTITGGMNFSGGFSIQAPAPFVPDEYFEYTTLLLPGNGANAGTNNTFLDSSTNNFTITRNGDTTQGTFSPFSQTGWSNYFDGTGDYLTVPNNSQFNFGSGDFTVECWIYPTTVSLAEQAIMGLYGYSSNRRSWYFYLANRNLVIRWDKDGLSPINEYTSTTSPVTANQWHHVAFVRNGTSFKGYVNGVEVCAGTDTADASLYNNTVDPLSIGAVGPTYTGYFNGYISNARIVKGTALYTSNFTPSTTPLTAVSGTSVLTCQSNRFTDNSTNNFTITAIGNTSVLAFSPFNPASSYSTSTNGGSGYFDGSGDYLNIADNNALDFSTGNFTIECWFYPTVTPSGAYGGPLVTKCSGLSGWILRYTSANRLAWVYPGDAAYTFGPTFVNNTWYHVAIVFSGSAIKGYVNGVEYSIVNTYNNDTTQPVRIGTDGNGSYTGYISDVRIVKGTAVYTSAFTPPTAPLTAIANTSLLCNFTNGQVVDATSTLILETGGNASISTTQSKFGGSSMYFDGVSDELLIKSSPVLNFGSDFTIEFWVYLNTLEDNMRLFNRQVYTSSPNIELQTRANGALAARLNSTADPLTTVSAAGVLTTGAWYHIAFVRSGTATNNVNVYVNGVSVIAFTNTAACNPSADFYIANYPGLDRTPNCYMNDFRITNGYARYTTNFTPPTTAFPTY